MIVAIDSNWTKEIGFVVVANYLNICWWLHQLPTAVLSFVLLSQLLNHPATHQGSNPRTDSSDLPHAKSNTYTSVECWIIIPPETKQGWEIQWIVDMDAIGPCKILLAARPKTRNLGTPLPTTFHVQPHKKTWHPCAAWLSYSLSPESPSARILSIKSSNCISVRSQ